MMGKLNVYFSKNSITLNEGETFYKNTDFHFETKRFQARREFLSNKKPRIEAAAFVIYQNLTEHFYRI